MLILMLFLNYDAKIRKKIDSTKYFREILFNL